MLTFANPWLERGETMVCFGDSLTENPKGYTGRLQKELRARGIVMIRAGRSGDKTPTALTRIGHDVLRRKPDAVNIFLGTNDCVIGHGCWADEPTVPPAAYEANLKWMVHLCRQAGIAKVGITPPLFRLEGPAFAEFGEAMLPYRQAARAAADAMGARFAPADIAFAEEWARHPGHTGLLLTTDGVHLNETGCRLLVQSLLVAWGL